MTADMFEEAEQVGKIAVATARKARDTKLIKKVVVRNKEIQGIAEAYEQAKAAKKTLDTNPGDPEANVAVGKYLCFVKGDWDKGLPMLASGSDEKLKALAVKELKGATGADAEVAVGDGWWDLRDKEERAKQRAVYWYKKALPGLTGLVKDKANSRLAAVAEEENVAAPKPQVRRTRAETGLPYNPKKAKVGRIQSTYGAAWCIGVRDGRLLLTDKRSEQYFRVHPGFSSQEGVETVSLEPSNAVGYFLIYDGRELRLAPFSRQLDYQRAASFKLVSPPIDGNDKSRLSFESVAFPKRYIVHGQFKIYVKSPPCPNGTAEFRFISP